MEPSLIKIVIAAVVIWFVWRWLGRLTEAKSGRGDGTANRRTQNTQARDNQANSRQGNPTQAQRPIEDMVKCPKCGAYVPARGGHDCSKA